MAHILLLPIEIYVTFLGWSDAHADRKPSSPNDKAPVLNGEVITMYHLLYHSDKDLEELEIALCILAI